jgi:sugar-specific transcriptional regulator TrmB/CBS domain-containing protein
LAQEAVIKALVDIGLTQMDSQVYLLLAKKGPLKGKEIFKALKINRQQLYRSLKNLQSKGIVSSTLERPARFSAISFEKVLDMFIKSKADEAQRLQQQRSEILSLWQSAEISESVDTSAKFMVIEGTNNIYLKVMRMINETQSQLSIITTVQGLLNASNFGVFDAGFTQPLKSQIQIRFLTGISQQNVGIMKTLLKSKINNQLSIQGRSTDSDLKLIPRMVIRDDEEILLFISSKADMSSSEREDTGFWTNSKVLVHAFKAMFEEHWRNSTDIQKKIVEIETGKPTPETYVIKNAEIAHNKYDEIMGSAKEEIVSITSSKGILRFWKKAPLLKEWTGRGLSVRIMAPITNENLKAAQQLSKYGEVRHVATNCLRTTVVDGKHLFMFKTPPPDQEKLDASSYFEGTFYTNDLEYVDRAKDTLDDIWKSTCDISAATLETITRSPAPLVNPTDSISAAAKIMANDDVGAVVVVENKMPVGIITEKDIVNRVINVQKDPAKTLVKDVMTAPVVTVDHKQTTKEALELMRTHKIRRLVVVKGKKIAGLVTERRALKSFSMPPNGTNPKKV